MLSAKFYFFIFWFSKFSMFWRDEKSCRCLFWSYRRWRSSTWWIPLISNCRNWLWWALACPTFRKSCLPVSLLLGNIHLHIRVQASISDPYLFWSPILRILHCRTQCLSFFHILLLLDISTLSRLWMRRSFFRIGWICSRDWDPHRPSGRDNPRFRWSSYGGFLDLLPTVLRPTRGRSSSCAVIGKQNRWVLFILIIFYVSCSITLIITMPHRYAIVICIFLLSWLSFL